MCSHLHWGKHYLFLIIAHRGVVIHILGGKGKILFHYKNPDGSYMVTELQILALTHSLWYSKGRTGAHMVTEHAQQDSSDQAGTRYTNPDAPIKPDKSENSSLAKTYHGCLWLVSFQCFSPIAQFFSGLLAREWETQVLDPSHIGGSLNLLVSVPINKF